MARKKKEAEQNKKKINTDGIMGLVGSTTEQAISETLEINYMPYAMSVIVSRAIPEIDGFKQFTTSIPSFSISGTTFSVIFLATP